VIRLTLEDVIFSAGGGFLVGALAGYAIKKLMKPAAIVLGLFVVGVTYLSYKGWVDVKWIAIENTTKSALISMTNQAIHSLNNTASHFQNNHLPMQIFYRSTGDHSHTTEILCLNGNFRKLAGRTVNFQSYHPYQPY
jgi:uncharacterized membrane protein (Fun14 family)